ncbi:macro domain-containing protein [Candidatus Pacearchaeota archaeon]|nr:macro domain-containing protein [Candidatus Pacearchaeota archaeon]
MSVVQIEGDLIQLAMQGKFDVIIHGANCRNVMDSGIAAQIKHQLPEAFEADREFASEHEPEDMLGNYSYTDVQRGRHSFYVVNAYTQLSFGPGLQISYEAVKQVFTKIDRDFSCYHLSLAYPLIGAGLGGGDWEKITTIIDEAFIGRDHTLVIYKP